MPLFCFYCKKYKSGKHESVDLHLLYDNGWPSILNGNYEVPVCFKCQRKLNRLIRSKKPEKSSWYNRLPKWVNITTIIVGIILFLIWSDYSANFCKQKGWTNEWIGWVAIMSPVFLFIILGGYYDYVRKSENRTVITRLSDHILKRISFDTRATNGYYQLQIDGLTGNRLLDKMNETLRTDINDEN